MEKSQDLKWFEELSQKRRNAVNVLKEEGLIDVFVSHIIDTYRESAHFIYELLQNADDALATNAKIELRENGVVFSHNGSVNFTISDPKIEREPGVIPGHINAITTFSLSQKKEDVENKIGKFGIGFKSVFQYTATPHIFNPPYYFRIKNYMIPEQISLETDNYLKENDTTAFWLPFDNLDKQQNEAFDEISLKLNELKNPLLFLRSLKNIKIISKNGLKEFTKILEPIEITELPNIDIQKVIIDSDAVFKFNEKAAIKDKNGIEYNLPIAVAFPIKGENVSSNESFNYLFQTAWCFFPTKQPTGLNFILNAPFILTPNREALKENRTENLQLINALANLIEKSIDGLKALGYINELFFTTISQPTKLPIEFKPIGLKVISKLKSGEYIPTKNGSHTSVNNAYICREPLLIKLLEFNNYLPLKKLTKKQEAQIVFSDGKLFSDSNLFTFIYKELSAVPFELNANWLGNNYDKSFLDGMSEEFIIMFFKFLNERSTSILGAGQPLWKKQFIPVNNGLENSEIVKPNNNFGFPHVFIGGKLKAGRYVLVDYLFNEPDLINFFKLILKFRTPNEFDDFYQSLEKYEDENHSVPFDDAVSDFNLALKYLNEVSILDHQKLLSKLKELKFVIASSKVEKYFYINPSKVVTYYPTNELKSYFDNCININWMALNKYEFNSAPNGHQKSFLDFLHVQFKPYYWLMSDNRKNVLHCLKNILPEISLEKSIYLVDVLYNKNVEFKGELEALKTTAWLFDETGIKQIPKDIFVGKLHKNYSVYANSIHIALGGFTEVKTDRYTNLNDDEKEILKMIISSLGELTKEEIKVAVEDLLKKRKAENKIREQNNNNNKTINKEAETSSLDDSNPITLLESWSKEALQKYEKKVSDESVSGNIIPTILKSEDFWKEESDDLAEIENPGGFVSAAVIGTKYKDQKTSSKKQQFEKDFERESKRNKLIELASQFDHYTFGWFKTLLELEDNFTSEDRVRRNPIRVIFNKAYLDNDGLLVLSDTAYIPPTIEEIGELSIQLIYDDDKKTIKGEVVSPKRQELLIKLSNPDQILNIPLERVSSAIVEASSPDFILERLKTAFAKLNFKNEDNLHSAEVLPQNLNFVFGPPGTGKTTYLSMLIGGKNSETLYFENTPISPLMLENKKVLVLTPTNKSADVLVQKILSNYQNANDYPQWLIRYGQSEVLEREAVFVGNKILKPWIYDKCTLVTTIARYPYDYFKVETKEEFADWKLKDFNWDVIIFDEASMIHQSAILYVIYYSKQINPNIDFFIGGDPFQIPPITQFEYPYWSYLPEKAFDEEGKPITDELGDQMVWKQDGGNIYAFVGLMKDDSFTNPITIPHDFRVHNLKTQFRSVAPIGALFGNYRYNNKLLHFRTDQFIKQNLKFAPKNIEIAGLPLKPITIIKFPVKKYESIYRVRSINGSPYQLYSALFTFELIKYIQKNAIIKDGEMYRVGIISPYAIQSNIISKLLNTIGTGAIEVVAGTVHSFQGDECNLVIVVLNPPKNINRSIRSFINKKNILNVAISRAMDKMILLIPFDPNLELNIDDLHQIKWITKLAGTLPECNKEVIGYTSVEIEKKLWGNDKFIENSTFATTHQVVNIYTEGAKPFEIRQNENAIDIQIRK